MRFVNCGTHRAETCDACIEGWVENSEAGAVISVDAWMTSMTVQGNSGLYL